MTSVRTERLRIPVEWAELCATLTLPDVAEAVVVFPHGGSAHDFRLATALHNAGIGTLVLDLVTEEEVAVRRIALDLHFLARRLSKAARWVRERPEMRGYQLGFFATGTGAASALIAAADEPRLVRAIMSFNGRVDLALYSLKRVETPTLLIVDGRDTTVAEVNRRACSQLPGEKRLLIIRGAAHPDNVYATKDIAVPAAEWLWRHRHARANGTNPARRESRAPAGELDHRERKPAMYHHI